MNKTDFKRFLVQEMKIKDIENVNSGGELAKLAGKIVGYFHNAVDWCAENLSSNTSSSYMTQL